MNSEVPQNPEPDFSSFFTDDSTFDSVDWVDTEKKANSDRAKESEAPKVESEVPPDIWLDELDTDPVVPPATSQPTTILSDSESQLSPDTWLDESETNELTSPEDEKESASIEPTATEDEPELFADRWLDESETADLSLATDDYQTRELQAQVTDLEQQKQILTAEIKSLEERKIQILTQQSKEIQNTLGRMVEEGMRELKERKNTLQLEIDKLERRRERIRQEMRTNFAGVSQELAIRVQGFKDYLVGSLQDLAVAAEQLELARPETKVEPTTIPVRQEPSSEVSQPQFVERGFAEQGRRIKSLLEQYRNRPDYYGPPWQLRRTFEPIHVERVQEWFFSQGGRGAIKSMGSRLQNILVASAIISVLHHLYGDRCRILILAESPERLGEWRRALQDCLGISRSDFGSNRGVGLFEAPEALVQKAERLVEEKLLPLVIIDETEEQVNLSLLRFPMWLAFAPEPQPISSGYVY
ncbi:DUF3086 domain-containing protein [Pleurocapsales cyanobacterium LEGE 06147]|nr:DUF3086 domain-containing protein [Pleurocapsales cyanobacterium LEGE 06147]